MHHRILVALLAAGLALAGAAAAQDGFVGEARVIDGDTIAIAGRKFRLEGLHAPEVDEPGGTAATRFMRDLLSDRRVACAPTGDRSYDRLIAVCRLADEGDIAAALVKAGLGRDCARYSGGRYAHFETSAGARLPLPGYCER
ncbi:MAG: thermonuclease family protein [Alphaproteobacteria bacterium]|jgi:endonuclease YncB( thermonuclease family)|nr:thermonuclease family protein [Alphaproteobacteria bacterium]